MSLMEQIKAKAKSDKKHILLPEGTEERTVQAAARIVREGLADVTLLGKPADIRAVAERFSVDLGRAYRCSTRRPPSCFHIIPICSMSCAGRRASRRKRPPP